MSDNGRALFSKSGRQKARLDAIVKTAARLIYERGVARTSLDDVADELGIAKPSLYHYVKGKEDLIYLCNRRIVELKGEAIERAQSKGTNSAERLELYARELIQIVLDPESGMPRLWQDSESILSGEKRDSLETINAVHSKQLQKWLRDGRRDGSLTVDNVEAAETALIGAIYWVPMSSRSATVDGKAIADALVKIFLDGLRPRH